LPRRKHVKTAKPVLASRDHLSKPETGVKTVGKRSCGGVVDRMDPVVGTCEPLGAKGCRALKREGVEENVCGGGA